jgi:hypothetical protein
VAWRTDRWTRIAQGNRMLSNWRGVPPGKKVELGRRFANWVTLESRDGRKLSVVSVHLAPETKGMPDLRRIGVERLNMLVERLAANGPVLVGGDFNVGYRSSKYPRDLFALGKLEPTFDTLGTSFPTGDHFGATIDYIFNRGESQLRATAHWPVELHSDHDAVVADFAWLVDAPSQTTTVTNNPKGNGPERRRAARGLVTAVAAVPAGGNVQVLSSDLRHAGVQKALRTAATRGVKVRYLTRSAKLTPRERGLRRHFNGAAKTSGSILVRCQKACRTSWRTSGMPKSVVVVADPQAKNASLRLDASRNLNPRLVRMRTKLVRYAGPLEVTKAESFLRTL